MYPITSVSEITTNTITVNQGAVFRLCSLPFFGHLFASLAIRSSICFYLKNKRTESSQEHHFGLPVLEGKLWMKLEQVQTESRTRGHIKCSFVDNQPEGITLQRTVGGGGDFDFYLCFDNV